MIDPTTNLGKVRLRVGDFTDVPWLPDSVYLQTLADNNQNIVKTSVVCAQYILGLLTRNTRSKLAQMESYDELQFEQYKEFIILTITNPAFMPYAPVPFGGDTNITSVLQQFQKNWNAGYVSGTADQDAYYFYTINPIGQFDPFGNPIKAM